MNLTTVLMMIVMSSFTLALLTWLLGQKFWQDGCWRIAMSLALFGVAYVCLGNFVSPLRSILLGIGYVVFSCAFCATTAALHRFYRYPLRSGWLLLGPVCIGLLYLLVQGQPNLLISCIYTLLAAQNLWIMQLLLRRGMRQIGRGEVLYLLGVIIMTNGLILRTVYPQASLAALPSESSASEVLIPYVGFFIAMHFKAVGFVMMAHTRAQLQLQRIADEDSLTGLPNRRSVMQSLQQEFDKALRNGSNLAVLLMDIDHFKRVNDQCGHPGGDRVLSAMGQILRQQLRPLSVAGRYGGEEFMVVCPQTSPEEALQLARRLCEAARSELRATHAQGSWPVTISVGISNLSAANAQEADGAHILLQQADQALYKAKYAGRNQAQVFDAATDDVEIDSQDIVNRGLAAINFPERLVLFNRDSEI